ncbi:MAG TPA: ATP-binding protein [Flavisolibacter sp.]|nr:ATP-binding protein [Flavisolibacter sp.]
MQLERSVIDDAPCLYFSSTDNGFITDVNETLCRKLGYLKSELIHQKVETIFTIATKIFQQTHFFPLLKMQGFAEEVFITLQKKDKDHLPVLISAERKEMNGENISVYVGIVVENRKKFEEELIAARKAAEAALNENTALVEAKQSLQKHLEELDQQIVLVNKQNTELRQFNRVVTHDLQEPLRKLSVFANMLLDNRSVNAVEGIVEKLIRVSEHMRSVVSGLQQYVWLTESPIESVELDLNKVLLIVQHQLKKDFPTIDLVIEIDDLPRITADKEQVQVLFYQLLSNAIKFRKEGNSVTIQITADNLLLNQFRNISGKYKYADFLRLKIRDNGIGFSSEYKELVFELFKRLHVKSGLGIGLSLCKKIVDNHYGNISISSQEGVGTTVTILLPLKGAAVSKTENTISKTI